MVKLSMTTKDEILNIIHSGEGPKIEFKLDDVRNETIAREICAFCNAGGGSLVLGVDDAGTIIGCKRNDNEERVMNLCYNLIEPHVFPDYNEIYIEDKRIAIVQLKDSFDKPYALCKGSHRQYFIRMGSTCREAGRTELLRLFQNSAFLHYEILERKGASLEEIDMFRFKEYLRRLFLEVESTDQIQQIMNNKRFLSHNKIPTLAGLALFGRNHIDSLPMLKVDIVRFSGDDQNYDIINQRTFSSALLNSYEENSNVNQFGLIDKCMDFLRVNMDLKVELEGARRKEYFDYPIETIRELLVNALVHRDYTIEGEGIRIFIYNNRMEFISPGGLPNSIHIDDLRNALSLGVIPTYARNPILVEVLKLFGYIENIGMGMYKKVYLLLQKYNGTLPVIEDTGRLFRVTIFKKKREK
ncbi:putative Histidine kinase [Candidatus Magnetomoraceae bacterium gMMP-15]